jgi:hypothetical protein
MLAHPIGIDSSGLFFSLFLCKETTKKYLHRLKCGSIPKYPSHRAMKAVMCWIPFGFKCCNSIL